MYKNIDMVEKYGLDFHKRTAANAVMPEDFRPEWGLSCRSPRPDRLTCPTNPGPRAVLTTIWEAYLKHAPRLESVGLSSGDVAGCLFGGCEPWWHNCLIHCNRMASLLHEYWPNADFNVDSQQMSADDIYKLVAWIEEHRDSEIDSYQWSNQADPYLPYGSQTDIRWPLSKHPIPWSRFISELKGRLGGNYGISMTADTTHWSRSQFAVPDSDPIMKELYRLVYHKQARPDGYYVNCGTPGEQDSLRMGWMSYGKGGWKNPQAPETRSFNYTSRMQTHLRYEFRTDKAYRVRMKCTLPGGTNKHEWGAPVTQNISAGKNLLGSVQLIAARVSEFEAHIPAGSIENGKLELIVENTQGKGTAAVSEIWLYCERPEKTPAGIGN